MSTHKLEANTETHCKLASDEKAGKDLTELPDSSLGRR